MHILQVTVQPGIVIISIKIAWNDTVCRGTVKLFKSERLIVFPSKWVPFGCTDLDRIRYMAAEYFDSNIIPSIENV